VYFTDRGLERLDAVRGDDQVSVAWLVEQMRAFVDLHPEHEDAIDRWAAWLAEGDGPQE
jgi:hypothetical protein